MIVTDFECHNCEAPLVTDYKEISSGFKIRKRVADFPLSTLVFPVHPINERTQFHKCNMGKDT